jgi:hypothetical protein
MTIFVPFLRGIWMLQTLLFTKIFIETTGGDLTS